MVTDGMKLLIDQSFDTLALLWRMSARNLWRQRRRSLLVMATAAVGMMGVLLTVAVMNGMARVWIEGSIESGLGHVQLRPRGYRQKKRMTLLFKEPEGATAYVLRAAAAVGPEVKHSLRFERMGLIRLGGQVQGLRVIGVDPAREAAVSQFDEWVRRGKYLTNADGRDRVVGIVPCLLGLKNAQEFEVDVGDTIVLSIGAAGGNTRAVRARVKGIFRSSAEPMDRGVLLVRRADLSRLFNGTDNQISYAVFVGKHRLSAETLRTRLLGAGPPGDLLTYGELQPGIVRFLEFADSVMFVFYVIMLTGFALVLLNAVLMSVFERMREFGIMRALGSSGGLVFLMIVFESVMLGLLGSLAGIAVSLVVTTVLGQTGLSLAAFEKGMELMGGMGTQLYPYVKLRDAFTGLAVALVMCLVASIYPALRAVRQNVVQAIYGRD